MEGIIYYWTMWFGWTIVTFWMEKGKRRWLYASFIMMNIIVSQSYWSFSFGQIGFSYFLFILFGIFNLRRTKKKVHSTFSVATIAFAYAGIELFHVYDPVWFFGNVSIICALLSFILSLLLSKTYEETLAYTLTGVCLGDALFWTVIFQVMNYPITIGSPPFLDTISYVGIFFTLWLLFKSLTKWLEQLVDKTIKEKERIYE
ncbi:hypothetical protein [Bacillus sp. FJAT-47783]|uniref:YphA family membrane protein n=1 Tax=Bacillus sp. FJAT-47783 TaxID=2922712 RepID=UPI001FACE8D9|nr:hypothetical protein [Bacillus sp. FJAT-47783]